MGIKPTGPEQEVPLYATDRFPCIGGGERGGKSWTTAAILLPHVIALPYLRHESFLHPNGKPKFEEGKDRPRNPHFVLFGPTYAQPRQEFQFLENWLEMLGKLAKRSMHVSKPQDGPWRMVTTDGVVIQTWSMEDPTSIRSVDLEGGAVCEAGACPYSGIERVQGRISAKAGFMVYSGTMEDAQQWWVDWLLIGQRDNHLGVKSYSLPTWTNRVEFPGGRNDPEILRLEAFYPEDIFLMRVAAEPRPPRFRVLKEIQADHVQKVDIPEDAAHEIWIDPGYATAYAILFVAIWKKKDGRKQFHFYDEFYEQGLNTADMIGLCSKKWSWPKVTDGVIDVASKGHRDATESALEIWQKLTSVRFNRKYWLEDRLIERIRTSAKSMQFTIDPKCRGLLSECGLGDPVFPEMHPWKYATDRDGRVMGEKPIDRWNHSAKALGYGLLHHLGQVETLRKPTSFNRLRKDKLARPAVRAG